MAENRVQNSFCYRLFYSRQENASFIAHLDQMRLFQRALRRAGLPLVYTQGFNPRPIFEFALPVGVGVETRFEPFEVLLSREFTAEQVKSAVNEKLPRGIKIEQAELISHKHKGLMSLVTAATYLIEAEGLGECVSKTYFDAERPLFAERIRKDKTRRYNLRDYILEMEILDQNKVRFKTKAGSSENLRPDLFLQAFAGVDGLSEEAILNARIIREKVHFNSDYAINSKKTSSGQKDAGTKRSKP